MPQARCVSIQRVTLLRCGFPPRAGSGARGEYGGMRQSLYRDKLTVPGFARVEVVETSPSTNAELVTAVRSDPADWPAPSALVAEHQTAGKGRAGRSWETPARAGLTVSVLLRPQVPAEALGWLPLLAGLAV